MSSRVLFPFKSSFYYLSLRGGSTLVAACDGLLSLVRMTLVLTHVEMFEGEHLFMKMDMYESKIRYSTLFGTNMLACLLLSVGIFFKERRPGPVLVVPWLVMFLCCAWLYYPNIIFHNRQPLPVTICVICMIICLYCWCVVLSFFLEILEASTASRKPPSGSTTTPEGVDISKG